MKKVSVTKAVDSNAGGPVGVFSSSTLLRLEPEVAPSVRLGISFVWDAPHLTPLPPDALDAANFGMVPEELGTGPVFCAAGAVRLGGVLDLPPPFGGLVPPFPLLQRIEDKRG